MKKRTIAMLFSASVSICLLTGCGVKKHEQEYIPIIEEGYEKTVYESVQVQTGTITPSLNLTLKPDEFEIMIYTTKQEFMEIESLNIEVGDKVQEGQVLIACKNDGLDQEIADLKNRNEENALLLNHYRNLAAIEKDNDYKDEIKSVLDDIELTNAYLKETEAKLKDYQIICERSGVVTKISEEVYWGYVAPVDLLEVTCGSTNFTTTTKDDYDFVIGDEFEANSGDATYMLRLVRIEENMDERTLIFEPLSDMSALGENGKLELVVEKAPVQNAKYVDEKAVLTVDGASYVFTLDENGFRHPVEVHVIDIIDDKAIIDGDIEDGEWVSIG